MVLLWVWDYYGFLPCGGIILPYDLILKYTFWGRFSGVLSNYRDGFKGLVLIRHYLARSTVWWRWQSKRDRILSLYILVELACRSDIISQTKCKVEICRVLILYTLSCGRLSKTSRPTMYHKSSPLVSTDFIPEPVHSIIFCTFEHERKEKTIKIWFEY